MLHIVNGIETLNLLDRTDIRGARVSGDDIFAEGPVPGGLEKADSWKLRAEYLQSRFGIPKEDYIQRKEARDRSLRSFAYHEEVVLWFESDLFCQINLLYLLNWFSTRDLGNSRLSLICPGEYPGVKHFKGLAALTPKQLRSLLDDRTEISRAQLNLARRAWMVYCAPDPTAIERLLDEGTDDLRHLRTAFYAHLERFPSVKNGLNAIESRLLEFLLNEGTRKFSDLFESLGSSGGKSLHGVSDLQFAAYLMDLAAGDNPLVRMESSPVTLSPSWTRQNAGKWTVRITDLGKEVAKGRQDSLTLRGIDRWLGGVHLKAPDSLWRWDAQASKLAPQAAPGKTSE